MQSTRLKAYQFGTQVTQLAVDLFDAHVCFLRWLEYRRKIESAQLPVGVVNGYAHVCTIMVNFPIMTSGWVANLRAVLELLFFISNIVIAAAVVYGLKQIALTKKIATSDARRESLKFAAERCQYYADHCVPADTKLRSQHQPLNLTYLATGRVPFSIVEGEIRTQFFNDKVWTPEFMRAGVLIADCLNSLEAFAIPFAAGVADDELGYQEAASSFCQLVEQHIAMIVLFRRMGPRYESTIRLYDRWKSRLVAQQTEGQLKKLQELHKQTSEKGKVKQTDDLL